MMKKLLTITLLLLIVTITFSQEDYYDDVNVNLSGSNLKDALATKIIETHSNMLSYTPGVWAASKVTDKDTDASKVVLIYGWENGTDNDNTNDRTRDNRFQDGSWSGSLLWNREHVFSKSLANPSLTTNNPGPGTDAHNLRPADKNRNSARNNFKFAPGTGNSGRSNTTYNGPDGANTKGWYPGDEWKGDVSRIIMYMYLRYGAQCLPTNVGVGSGQFTEDDMIDLFLKWNAEDPVSDFEKARNTYHENTNNTYAQGNRNPFIDNPYLATRIWGGDAATDTWGIYISSDTEAPTTPTNVTLSNISLTSIDISWTASTDNEAVVGYDVLVDGVLNTKVLTTSAKIDGLETNTTYNFQVIARDQVNSSPASAQVPGKTLVDTEAPSIPSNVTITNITDSSFKINWTASTDNNKVASYDVFIDNVFKASSLTTSYTVTGLTTLTSYSATILAKDVDDNKSSKSTPIDARTTDGSSGGTATELFISEYIEGTGTNKVLEIVNLTGATVSLVGYEIRRNGNGGESWSTPPLALDSGKIKSIIPGDVFVVGNESNLDKILQAKSDDNLVGQVDLVHPNNDSTNNGEPISFNGDDPVGLFKDGVLIDIVGVFNNGGNVFAKDVTLRRNGDITGPSKSFNEAKDWTVFPLNTFDGLGSHTTALSSKSIIFEAFKMFPNPANGKKVYFSVTEDANINIYNVLGKLIKSTSVTKSKNSINISDLSKGIYLLKIKSGNQFITKKLLKN